ncbi:MAG TPA: hypothetical protein VGP28_04725 [Methylocella sp.]|jgi:hypothetical protein|nr:hypothetical protein [Methylocella sp.]
MRSILTAVFAAALIAAPAHSNATPRSIDGCEKIQAADAYNQCLAAFGPIARGHGAAGDGVDADRQDGEAPLGSANAGVAAVAVSGRDHGARHASRHGWTRHSWARQRHGDWHRTRAAAHRHGKTTTMAFSVVSGHTRLR